MMDHISDHSIIHLVTHSGAYVSAVSVFEMAIKHSIGKLTLPSKHPAKDIEDQGFLWLEVSPYHAERVITLPYYHKDPFDRLIIAQALHENMHILTYDSIFQRYTPSVTILQK